MHEATPGQLVEKRRHTYSLPRWAPSVSRAGQRELSRVPRQGSLRGCPSRQVGNNRWVRCAGILLTGGSSRRMGTDKATLPVASVSGTSSSTLARRTAEVLTSVTVLAVEVGIGASDLACSVENPAGGGPLAGLVQGAQHLSETGWDGPVLVVATDMPLLGTEVLRWLVEYPGYRGVVPVAGGQPQPLCARYSPAEVRAARDVLAGGSRSMRDFLAVGRPRLVDPGTSGAPAGWESLLADVDTPADLAGLRRPAKPEPPPASFPYSTPTANPTPASPTSAKRSGSVTALRALKVRPGRRVELPDDVATEEPLQIMIAGPGERAAPLAVTMRTPGHDFELAAGFVFSEGVAGRDEIRSVDYCEAAGSDPAFRWNHVAVRLSRLGPRNVAVRAFNASASCGTCGKATIDDLFVSCGRLDPGQPWPASVIPAFFDGLRAAQKAFDRTGGLHAAGLFDREGNPLIVREDIGRHNAVDKVVGATILTSAGLYSQPSGYALAVSGRVSFEIVQKAAVAGIALLAAVSAPSSLAVQAAAQLGVTLVAFVRNDTFNVYSGPELIDF
ncbi:MAG: formate dehydrogenase accessory sulfurtransferase FdhD [Acidimicrobiales bacterium]